MVPLITYNFSSSSFEDSNALALQFPKDGNFSTKAITLPNTSNRYLQSAESYYALKSFAIRNDQ